MAILLLTRNFVNCCCPCSTCCNLRYMLQSVCWTLARLVCLSLWTKLSDVVLEATFGCSIPSRWVSGSYTQYGAVAHHCPMWPPTHQVGKYLSKIKIREMLAVFVAWVGEVYPYYPIWKIGAAFTQLIICLGGLIWEKYEPSLLAWVGKCIPMQHEIDMSLPHLHWWENVYPMC